MRLVKLNLQGRSIPDKVNFGKSLVAAITGNPNFATPDPSLSSMTATINSLEIAMQTAEASRDKSRMDTELLAQAEVEADVMFTSLGSYVDTIAKGNAAVVLSAGMEVRATASPLGPMPQPQGLAATEGDMQCSIDLSWDRVKGAKSYIVQMTQDVNNAASWVTLDVAPKSSYCVKDLASGQRYWFRVAAVGTEGAGPWTDPATKIAP
jgi:hypothetical protein